MSNDEIKVELDYLLRKAARIYSETDIDISFHGYINFKHLGLAVLIADARKHELPRIRFVTRNHQQVVISALSADYVKKAGKVHKLHDEDVKIFDEYLKSKIPYSNSTIWDTINLYFREWFPHYYTKHDQPDYSKLNSTL